MKVKIQYTVDIDAIPEEVERLTGMALSEISAASDMVSNMNAHGSIAEYEEMNSAARAHMLNADLVLSDCAAILSGYASAKHSQEQAAKPADSMESQDIE
jgi:hypothetical protein